jgi:hypothetical protein
MERPSMSDRRKAALTLALGAVGIAAAYMAPMRSASAVAKKWLRLAALVLP